MKKIISIVLLVAIVFAGYKVYTTLSGVGYNYDRERGVIKTETVVSVKSPFSGKTYEIETERESSVNECANYILNAIKTNEEP